MGVISHGIFRPLPGETAPEDEKPTLRTVRRPDLYEEEEGTMGDKRQCLIEGCDKDVFCRGLCQPHHDKLRDTPDFKEKYPTKHKRASSDAPAPLSTKPQNEHDSSTKDPDRFTQIVDNLAKKQDEEPAAAGDPGPDAIPTQLPEYMQKIVQDTATAIMIDLSLVPGLHEWLSTLAAKDLRSIECQALYMLKGVMGFNLSTRPVKKPVKIELTEIN